MEFFAYNSNVCYSAYVLCGFIFFICLLEIPIASLTPFDFHQSEYGAETKRNGAVHNTKQLPDQVSFIKMNRKSLLNSLQGSPEALPLSIGL